MLVNADTIYSLSAEKNCQIMGFDRHQSYRIIGVPHCQCDLGNDTISSAPFILPDEGSRHDIYMDKFYPYMAFYNNDTIFSKEFQSLFVSTIHKEPYIEVSHYLLKKNNNRVVCIDSVFNMY